jgi:hypothetical protein
MAVKDSILTLERLKELLHYDPETGIFTRRITRRGVPAGQVAGSVSGDGHLRAKLDNLPYLCHRLAWFYVNGTWPTLIDHINGDPKDNRIANLRDASHAVNMQNRQRPHKNNRSGFLGIRFIANRWRASISLNGKVHNLGRYKTPEEAQAAYFSAKRFMHPGNTL